MRRTILAAGPVGAVLGPLKIGPSHYVDQDLDNVWMDKK